MGNGGRLRAQLAGILSAQSGAIAVRQAEAKGIARMRLWRLARAECWRRPFRGVYVVPDASGFEPVFMAAVLWAGAGAVVSHRAAARLWGISGFAEAQPELLVPRSRLPRSGHAIVHQGEVADEDRCELKGIPVTTLARTLIDLAAVVNEDDLAIAVEDCWKRGRITPEELTARLQAIGARGRRGARALGRVLKDCCTRGKPMDSALEVRFWRWFKTTGLALPHPGHEVEDDEGPDMRIDFAFVQQRVALETNGRKFHGPDAHERDSLRLSRLAALGWRVLHVTKAQLGQPKRLRRRIARTLAFNGADPRPRLIVYGDAENPAQAWEPERIEVGFEDEPPVSA